MSTHILPSVDSSSDLFAKSFGGGLGRGIEQGFAKHQALQVMNKENESLKRIGLDLQGITSPELRKSAIEQHYKGVNQQNDLNKALTVQKLANQSKEKIAAMKSKGNQLSISQQKEADIMAGANEALNKYENLVGEAGIGYAASWNPFPGEESRFNKGEADALETAILPILKEIFPRLTNTQFQHVIKKHIPQSDDSLARIQGKIAGIRKLIKARQSRSPTSQGQEGMGEIEKGSDGNNYRYLGGDKSLQESWELI